MSAVASEYRKTKEEVTSILNHMQDVDITPEILLLIDYAYHNTDSNYEDGLSFLDRLHWKLSMYFPIQWNVGNLKKMIRDSNNPAGTFVDVLNELLTPAMIECYGV